MTTESFFKLSLGTIYSIVVSIYIHRLKLLNVFLIKNYSNKSALSLLQYNNYQPTKYFIFAFFSIIAGGLLLYLYYRWIIDYSSESSEKMIYFAIMVIIVIIEVLVIKNINIPIFQAILSILVLGSIISISMYARN